MRSRRNRPALQSSGSVSASLLSASPPTAPFGVSSPSFNSDSNKRANSRSSKNSSQYRPATSAGGSQGDGTPRDATHNSDGPVSASCSLRSSTAESTNRRNGRSAEEAFASSRPETISRRSTCPATVSSSLTSPHTATRTPAVRRAVTSVNQSAFACDADQQLESESPTRFTREATVKRHPPRCQAIKVRCLDPGVAVAPQKLDRQMLERNNDCIHPPILRSNGCSATGATAYCKAAIPQTSELRPTWGVPRPVYSCAIDSHTSCRSCLSCTSTARITPFASIT